MDSKLETGKTPGQEITYRTIGIVHTPYKTPEGTPINPHGGEDTKGIVEIFPEYTDGLKDIEGFSHIILLYHLHRVTTKKLVCIPFMDDQPHGCFATRSPSRPNSIGLSVVRLIKVNGWELEIANVDIVDGTPLLDIKPFMPEVDYPGEGCMIGWVTDNIWKRNLLRDDGRYSK